jgi:hypothetical protein
MLQYGVHLVASYAREPLKKILHASAALEILKKSPHWNAGSFEDPSAANLIGVPLHGRTLAPVDHHPQCATSRHQRQDALLVENILLIDNTASSATFR